MMKRRLIPLLLVLTGCFFSCSKHDHTGKEPCDYNKDINENIIRIRAANYPYYEAASGIWLKNNTIFSTNPLQYRIIDADFSVIKDSIIGDSPFSGKYFIESSPSEKKILYVRTTSNYYSKGALMEYDIETGTITELLDATHSISSAVYYRDDDHIIYYTYGDSLSVPGYFLYSRLTGESTLIFSYLTQFHDPESEVVNGFDIHPTENILLVPAAKEGHSPSIVTYNMNTHVSDTLDMDLIFSPSNPYLWLRYNKTGDKILYSCYSKYVVGADHTTGIIDLNTMTANTLDVRTDECRASIDIFPSWSPDDHHIVYSSGNVKYPSGEHFRLYILKNVN